MRAHALLVLLLFSSNTTMSQNCDNSLSGKVTDLHDGRLYLFNWNGSVILRRWRDNPSRLEPAASPGQFETLFPDGEPVVIASALQSIRDLWEPLPK